MSRDMFETMLLIRAVEDRLQALCLKGEAGDLHFSKGQEAISVGVCSALESTDKIVTHHRTIAHQIARATSVGCCDNAFLRGLLGEVLGKRTGVNRGRAGEMHIHDSKIGHTFSFQLVGTCVPVAAGLAWALRFAQQTEKIVAVFLGDAAFSNGAVHEGLNIAAVQRCPLLIVVEDNSLAGNIEPVFYRPLNGGPQPAWKDRFQAYGIESHLIGGNDPQEIDRVTGDLARYVRATSSPFGLVCGTHRLCWHKQGQRDVRLPTEIANLARFDPLLVMQRRLALSNETVAEARVHVEKRLDGIFETVLKDPPAEMHYDD